MNGFIKRCAVLLAAGIGLTTVPAVAAPVCTLVADAATGRLLVEEGTACDVPASPASTFKIALALMGFDLGLLIDERTPSLPYKDDYAAVREEWKQTTDPASWMRDSVVWYSQELTRAMGMDRFEAYVEAFDYGNRNLAGDEGMGNGLTNAWLSSSLRISPTEQLAFLGKLWNRRLPVTDGAVTLTRAIMPMFSADDGWTVWGKTGTGFAPKPDGTLDRDHAFGWFVGWAVRDGGSVLFVRLIQDNGPAPANGPEPAAAGLRARDGLLADLPNLLRAP